MVSLPLVVLLEILTLNQFLTRTPYLSTPPLPFTLGPLPLFFFLLFIFILFPSLLGKKGIIWCWLSTGFVYAKTIIHLSVGEEW